MRAHSLKLAAVLLVTWLMAACGGSVDHSDPKSVAKAALAAYKDKSVDGLIKLAPESKRAKAEANKDKLAERAFKDGWRMKAVNDWGGDLGELKEKGDRARIKFHDMSDDEVAVVALKKVDGKWYFRGIKSPSKKSWEKWGK